MLQPHASSQNDAKNALISLAEPTAELECSGQEATVLETPPISDDDDNANNDPIYDGFVTNQNVLESV